ncbi:MAG: hypothetical protein HYS45_02710 [Parcubacteria group bacterium]|nr:hypothetical protein [Parcubacteria group bacterium]
MTQIMTPSNMTDGQIDKAGDTLRAVFCKHAREHRSEFLSGPTQQVLGNPAFAHKVLAVFRQMYEAVSGLIVRHVKQVDRTRTPQQMLDDLGRRQWTNRKVVDAMPRGVGQGGDIFFWPVGCYISDDDLEKEYQADGWVAADPYLVAAANKEDPALGDKHPNFTHWKNASGEWCYLACLRSGGVRRVDVIRDGRVWSDVWLFAVVRKPTSQAAAVSTMRLCEHGEAGR